MAAAHFSEVEVVQNAALAATMVWKCGMGYQDESESQAMEMPVAFLVLPICLHQETLRLLLSTQRRSGLSLFAGKLAAERENWLAVHYRTLAYRELTLRALGVGIQSKLLSIEYSVARVRSNNARLPSSVPERIKPLIRGSERFGAWCGRLTTEQTATTLGIHL